MIANANPDNLINSDVLVLLIVGQKEDFHNINSNCGKLLRDAMTGIVTQSPSILDLVKCDSVILYYSVTYWLMSVTPMQSHIKYTAGIYLILPLSRECKTLAPST